LPYFGGAGSDYLTHSIATIVEKLRRDPGAVGLCSGVGMHMTKHVYGLYSTEPPEAAPKPDQERVQRALEARPRTPIADTYGGEGTVATYTVLHGSDGKPDWGLVVCDLTDGRRSYGHVGAVDMLQDLERDECVGRRVRLETNDSNVNEVTTWVR
jgi:acetyl-CoA C-acetyltransferase